MEQIVPADAMNSSQNEKGEMTLQMLIEKLHILFSEDRVNVEEVHHVMSSYRAEGKEWEKYTSFDPYRYEFKTFSFIKLKL